MAASFTNKNFLYNLFRKTLKDLKPQIQSWSQEKSKLIESLRFIAESLVWSEQHNQNFFIDFVSTNALNLLNNLLELTSDKQIIIQLIQTANLLAHNISIPEHKVYLISSEFYSNIVSNPFNFADDDIVENYISLLKSLATNVSSDKLICFIVDNNFSLYARAIMFINNPDNLIKTAARTVILTILKSKNHVVSHPDINAYIIESGFVFNIVNSFKEQVFAIDKVIKSGKKNPKLDFMINGVIDLLFYINDMLEQVDPIFSFQLSNTFIQILAPILIGSINSEVHSSYHVAIHVAYYLLVQIFMNSKYQSLVDAFSSCLLGKNIPQSLLNLCSNPPPLSPPGIFDFDSDEKVSNPIRCSMFSFLKCKDDNLVCLSLLLIQAIIVNSGISKFLLQEFGLLSQKFFKVLNPAGFIAELVYQCDFEIMSALSAIYSTYPLFRFTVYHLVCKIFFELFCAKDFKVPLENEAVIRKVCCDTILKLEKLLESKEFSEILLDLFDEEWEFVKKISFEGFVGIQNFHILPVADEGLKIGLEHRQPDNDFELCRCLMKLFFLMRKLILSLKFEDPNVYPFTYTSKMADWQVGSEYETKDFEFLRVYLVENDYFVRYLAEDDDFFILVEPDLYKINFATVSAIEKWRNLSLAIDEGSQVACIFNKKQGKALSVKIMFENEDFFASEINKIEARIKNSKVSEVSMVESFLYSNYQEFLDKPEV